MISLLLKKLHLPRRHNQLLNYYYHRSIASISQCDKASIVADIPHQNPLVRYRISTGLFNQKISSHDHWDHHQRRQYYYQKSKRILLASLAFSGFISFRGSDDSSGPVREDLAADLRLAVRDGDAIQVQAILKKCSPKEINARHKLGWQPLHVAAMNGHSTICQMLLSHGANKDDIDNYTNPRELAKKLKIPQYVIEIARATEFNPDLAQVNFFGCTALHYAALSDDFDTVKVLAESGCNPLITNDLGHKPQDYAEPPIKSFLDNYTKEFLTKQSERDAEERRRYPLEKRIKEVLVGQDPAIIAVAATIRRKENGWFDEDHPIVFLFLGSSGIGKTELAKQVAKYLHKDDKKSFIRLDMSEYQEKHSVARMIGSPPGYIGHNEGGQLTDSLKKCRNAVVLLDEIEKAHPDVLTILLQLFDEGRLTDGKGETIECKDAIFIMTSNLASEEIAKHAIKLREEQKRKLQQRNENLGKKDDATIQEQETITKQFKDTIVRSVLKRHFKRDEFLGRINEMVYFLPFSEVELKQLVVRELTSWKKRAKARHSVELTWDESVVDVICKGYDIHYGARSLKHEIERRIVNQLSEAHYLMKKGGKIHITLEGEDLVKLNFS